MSLVSSAGPVYSPAIWSFENATNTLLQSNDLLLVQGVEQFVNLNLRLLTDPASHVRKSSSVTQADLDKGVITIDKAKYTLSKNILLKEVEYLSEKLNVDPIYVVKYIASSEERKLIELTETDENNKINLLPKQNTDKTHSGYIYTQEILKEKRLQVKLVLLLLKSESSSTVYYDLSNKILVYNEKLILHYIENISKNIAILSQVPPTPAEYDLTEIIRNEARLIVLEYLSLISHMMIPVKPLAAMAQKWFELMDLTSYLKLDETMHSLAQVITLFFAGFDASEKIFDISLQHLQDPLTFRVIYTSMAESQVPIMTYACGVLLYTKLVVLQAAPDSQFLAALKLSSNDFEGLASAVANEAAGLTRQFLDLYVMLFELLNFDKVAVQFVSRFLQAGLGFVSLGSEDVEVFCRLLAKIELPEILEEVLLSESFLKILGLLRLKFPEDEAAFEAFISVLSVDGSLASSILSRLDTYFHYFKQGELQYEAGKDKTVALTKDVVIKPKYEKENTNNVINIVSSTLITIVNNQAAIFKYNYNGWLILSKAFENVLNELSLSEYGDQYKPSPARKSTASDKNLISKLLNLLNQTFKDSGVNDVIDMFEKSSVDLFELFNQALRLALNNVNLKWLTLLNQLFHTLLAKGYSDEIWSITIKSNYHDENSNLYSIVAHEKNTLSFDYLLSLIVFTDGLVVSLLSTDNNYSKIKSDILTKLTGLFIGVFENFYSWHYQKPIQKFQIGISIIDLFSKIVFMIYSVGSKVNLGLKSCGEKIVDTFLNTNEFDCLVLTPTEIVINDLAQNQYQLDIDEELNTWLEQFIYVLFDFNRLIISLRSMLKLPLSTLENSVFSNLPKLIQIYVRFPSLKLKIMNLVIGLVNSDFGNSKPPSLLAHLGNKYSKILLNSIILDLENPLVSYDLKNALYDFFSNVMDKNQEGLSTILLNGDKNTISILLILKKNVVKLKTYPVRVAIHLLNAISFAFNSWIASKKIDDNDYEFILALTQYFQENHEFKGNSSEDILDELSDTIEKSIDNCYKIKLISSIGEILALYLFSSSNAKVIQPILDLLENKKFLTVQSRIIFQIDNYNADLHLNAHKNFSDSFGFKLDDFQRTSLNRFRRYGVNTVYNLTLMDKLFGDVHDWNHFIKHEVILASLNLQFVSAQTDLIKSWGALISSYTRTKCNVQFIDLASMLLSINNLEGVPAQSFLEIYLERVELAFYLVYTITKTDKKVSDDQLTKLFDALVGSFLSEEVNLLASLFKNDTKLYRSLLRILQITLNLCNNKGYLMEKSPKLFLDLFDKVIANGSKIIITSIQNDLSESTSNALILNKVEDLLLIISIFKSIVGLNLSEDTYKSLSAILDSNDTIRYILELYSYSSTAGDGPAYPDLALTYIVELISIDKIAEKLLDYGLFSILVNSPISLEIQKGSVRSDLLPKFHHIWSNGLLTTVLVLLCKFGPRVIPDICIFLAAFQKQISFTLENWSKNSLIVTLAIIRETSQLILLHKALNLLNYKEYINLEPAESILFFPGLEGEAPKLIDSFHHLLTHPKYLQSRIILGTFDEGNDKGKSKAKLMNHLISEIKDLSESISD